MYLDIYHKYLYIQFKVRLLYSQIILLSLWITSYVYHLLNKVNVGIKIGEKDFPDDIVNRVTSVLPIFNYSNSAHSRNKIFKTTKVTLKVGKY